MEVSQKLKIQLLYHLQGISLLGIYSDKTIIQKDTYTTVFIPAPLTIAKTWKQHTCTLTDEWTTEM